MSVSKSEVYEWIDSEPTQARGWICIDSVVNGCSSGQLEILCEGTREQAVELARRASFSSAVGVPQVGGASAVIRFDQSDMKCHSVIQRFLKAHMALFSNVLTLVGENDNDTLFLDQCLRSLKLTGSQHAVSKIYAKATNQTDLGESFGPSTTWLGSRVSLADLSRSFGVCQIIKSLKEATSLEKVRVILVGFGSLGSSVAYFIQNQNIGIVVGICDEDGFISSSEGLPVSDILNMRNVSLEKRRLLGQGLTETKRCKQNVLCNLDEAQLRQFNAVQRATSLGPKTLGEAEFIVFCDEGNIHSLSDMRALLALQDSSEHKPVLLFASSSSLYVQSLGYDSPEMETFLEEQGLSVIPQWLCTSGRDQMLRSLVTVQMGFGSIGRVKGLNRILDSIIAPIASFVQEAYFTFSNNNLRDFAKACEKLALQRMQSPLPFAVVKPTDAEIVRPIYTDTLKIQQLIADFLSEIKNLFRALFGPNNDAILLAMLEDLIEHFLAPALQHVYCAEDTGERKNKRFFLSVLEAVNDFLKVLSSVNASLIKDAKGDANMENMTELLWLSLVKRREAGALSPDEAASAVLKYYEIPFASKTFTFAIDTLLDSNKALIALDTLFGKAENDEVKEVLKSATTPSEVERHNGEFGSAIGGIISSVCELAQIPAFAQFCFRTFLFFGGGFFLGGKFDQQLEPNIVEDIQIVHTIANLVETCRHGEQCDEKESYQKILTRLEKILPSLVIAPDAPNQFAAALVKIFGQPKILKEMLYFYIIPKLIEKK